MKSNKEITRSDLVSKTSGKEYSAKLKIVKGKIEMKFEDKK